MRPGSDSVARYRAAFTQRNLVQEIEALTARALPPLTLLDLDGWQLRSAGGLTLRVSSVWPRAEGSRLDLHDRLRQTEAFYLQGGTDPAVQLSPSARPAGLEGPLSRRGYVATPPVAVRTASMDALPDRVAEDAVDLVEAEPWLAHWAVAAAASEHRLDMAGRVLERVQPPAAYTVLRRGRDVAVARGVLDGGWLGVDLVAATPRLRDPSTGAALLAGLARWARSGGAERVYCEVDQGDPAAVALLTATGFRRGFSYRFLVLPRALVRR